MIKVFSKLTNDKRIENKNNISFTGRRDDHNTVAILKNDKKALNVPVQRRIQESLTRLSKDGSDYNINFLLDVAENLQYGTRSNSEINKSISSDFKYNYLNMQKNTWDVLLMSSISEALKYNNTESKPQLEAKFNELYSIKDEIVYSVPPTSPSIVKPSISNEEMSVLELRDEILKNKQLNLGKNSRKPENYDKYIAEIKKNMDKFIVSPESSLSEKKECLKLLSHMLSSSYKINPQLKDRKPQILSEILTDLAGQSKSINQKHHGSCAGISISRKYMAAEHKLQFVQTILNELDKNPTMEVFDLYDYSKKVKVNKAVIDYNTALSRTYRVIDASVLNWMNIADTTGNGEKKVGFFNPFDAENYDMFHDGHYLNNAKDATVAKQFFLRGLMKVNEKITDISKMKNERNLNLDEFKHLEKTNNTVNAYTNAQTITILTQLGMPNSVKFGLKDAILNPSKVINPDNKIVKYDEDSLKKVKISNLILAQRPELADNDNFDKSLDKLVNVFNFKEESNTQFKEMQAKVKLSGGDIEMENEFKSNDYHKALFELEAYNRITKEFELQIPERAIFYRNKFKLPSLSERLVTSIDDNLKGFGTAPMEAHSPEEQSIIKSLLAFKEIMTDTIPKQLALISNLIGLPGYEGMKAVGIDYINIIKRGILDDRQTEYRMSDLLDVTGKEELFKKLDEVAANIEKQSDEKSLMAALKPIGIDDALDLYITYLQNMYERSMSQDGYKEVLAKVFANNSGEVVDPEETPLLLDEILSGLEDMEKQYITIADALYIPDETLIIMKKLEKAGEVAPQADLDKLFARYNNNYAYKEKRSVTDFNIFMNNKKMSEFFLDASDKIDTYIKTVPPKSIIADELNEFNSNLRLVSTKLQGVNVSKIEKKLREINKDITTIEQNGHLKDKSILSILAAIKVELEDKITEPPVVKNEDFSAFFKKAEDRFTKIKHDSKREKKEILKEMLPELEKAYREYGEAEGAYWVWQEGSSGLGTRQELRILSQLTGVDYYSQRDPVKAASLVKNGRNSGVDATSVSHNEAAMHAMYVYDVNSVKSKDKTGMIKDETIIAHDNSWGPKELNGIRKDDSGNLRTDYTRKFGENGGYFVKDGFLSGVTLSDFDSGQFTIEKKPREYNEYKAPVFSNMLLMGTEHDLKYSVASLYEDIEDLTSSTEPSDLLDYLDDGLLVANNSMLKVVEEDTSINFNVVLDAAIKENSLSDIQSKLQENITDSVMRSINVYKEGGREAIYDVLTDFVSNIQIEYDLNNPAEVNTLKADFKALVAEEFEKHTELKKRVNHKKFKEFEKLTELKEKELEKLLGIDVIAKGIQTREELESLPDTHPLRIVLNNMSFKSGKVSEKANHILSNRANEPYAYLEAKKANLEDRKGEILYFLNQTDYTKEHPVEYATIEDLKKKPTSASLINWIDKKFDPKDDDELMSVYRNLSSMDKSELMDLLDGSSESDLGIEYDDPYKIMKDIQVGRKVKMFHSAIANFVVANDIMTEAEKIKSDELVKNYNEWLLSKEGKSVPDWRQRSEFIERTNTQYLSNPDNLYRTLSIEYSNITLDKFLNAQKDEALNKYGVFASFPNLKVYSDEEIQSAITENLLQIIAYVEAVKKTREQNGGVPTKNEEVLRKGYQESLKSFVMTNIQPRYQAKVLDNMNTNMKHIMNLPSQEMYDLPESLIKFMAEKHISKDLPALLEHITKKSPEMNLYSSNFDNDIIDSWVETLRAGYRTAKLASIEFNLRKMDDAFKGGNIHQAARIYKNIVKSGYPNDFPIEEYFSSVLPMALIDSKNKNNTMKLFYEKMGLTNDCINYITDKEKLVQAVKDIKEGYNETLAATDETTKMIRAVETYQKITAESAKITLLSALRDNVSEDQAKLKQIKNHINLSNKYATEVLKISGELEGIMKIKDNQKLSAGIGSYEEV